MIDITPRPHHHLECWNHFVAGGTEAGVPKESKWGGKEEGFISNLIQHNPH